MKAKLSVNLLILFLSSVSLYSQNYSVCEPTRLDNENDYTKEYVITDGSGSNKIKKYTYIYNHEDVRKTRIVSLWNNKKDWVIDSKHEYEYNNEGQLASIIFTKWNKKINDWSNQSEYLVYSSTDGNNELTAKYTVMRQEIILGK